MSISQKKNTWWERFGMRFLGGESGQHIPTHKDFGLYGYDCGYRQCAEDHGIILVEEGISTAPQDDE
jgi:hypothetical protein